MNINLNTRELDLLITGLRMSQCERARLYTTSYLIKDARETDELLHKIHGLLSED